MEIYPLDIVIHIVNIIILYVLLRIILYKPIKKYMNQRTEKIHNQNEESIKKLQEADTLKQEYMAKISDVDNEGKKIIKTSTQSATEQSNIIIENANNKAQQIINDAQEKSKLIRQQSDIEMKNDLADVATKMAERVLNREVTINDNQQIIDNFLDEMSKK